MTGLAPASPMGVIRLVHPFVVSAANTIVMMCRWTRQQTKGLKRLRRPVQQALTGACQAPRPARSATRSSGGGR